MQFGTNHLGHFALTGLLLDHLLPVRGLAGGDRQQHWATGSAPRSTSTTCSGNAATTGSAAYGQSKLANLLFTYELQRRLAAEHGPTIAVAAHPGSSNTELTRNLPRIIKPSPTCSDRCCSRARDGRPADAAGRHRPGRARRPVLRARRSRASSAATRRWSVSSAQSHDEDLQRRLWAVSEELTGVTFPV